MILKKQTDVKTPRFFGLSHRILKQILPLMILSLSILGSTIFYFSYNEIKKKSEETIIATTHAASNRIAELSSSCISSLQQIKNTIIINQPETPADYQAILSSTLYSTYFPNGVYIGLTSGECITPSTHNSNSDLTSKDRSWYKKGLQTAQFTFTDAYFDETKNSCVSTMVCKLDLNSFVTLGTIAADIDLSSINSVTKEVQVEQTGQAILIDTSNNMIIGTKEDHLLGSKLEDNQTNPIFAAVYESLGNSNISTITKDGKQYLVQAMAIHDTPWVISIVVPCSEVFSSLYSLTRQIILLMILTILVVTVVLILVIRSISKPITEFSQQINELSVGNFNIEIKEHQKDEIGLMGTSLKHYIVHMKEILANVSDIAASLTTQAHSSTSVANNLSDSAKLQASSMEECKRTLEELVSSISEIAENTTNLANLSSFTNEQGHIIKDKMTHTVTVSKQGNSKMLSVDAAINDISTTIHELATSIHTVGTSMEDIQSIIKVIGSIADDTSLLALNASIEAARAGEHGQGFAVVAEEIGKLAHTCTTSVSDISKRIQDVSSIVNDTVTQTDESVDSIMRNSKQIKDISTTFTEIATTVKESDAIISKVLTEINQIAEVATNIPSITEEQSASAEEILATSETLTTNAIEVNENSIHIASDASKLADTSTNLTKDLSFFHL